MIHPLGKRPVAVRRAGLLILVLGLPLAGGLAAQTPPPPPPAAPPPPIEAPEVESPPRPDPPEVESVPERRTPEIEDATRTETDPPEVESVPEASPGSPGSPRAQEPRPGEPRTGLPEPSEQSPFEAGAETQRLVPSGPFAEQELRTTVGGDMADLDLAPRENQIELTLEEAVTLALERNLSIVVERYRRSRSLYGIEAALGIYDFNVAFDAAVSSEVRPPSTTLEDADAGTIDSDFLLFNADLTQLTPTGGLLDLVFDNQRFETSNNFVQPNPQFDLDLDLIYTQPLLRSFGRLATEREILVARTASETSREAFVAQVETVLQSVSDSYWLLVEARGQLAVAEESLGLARELHDMNRIQVDVGTLAPLEMVQSEAGMAIREEDIIRLQALVEDSADQLRQLLNLDSDALWNASIVPITDPTVTEYRQIDLESAVATAFAERPDIRQQRLELERRDIEARFARNQKKPRLDLQARYGYNALRGDEDDVMGNLISSGDYTDALQQILDRQFEGWQLGVTFAYPLQNRTARARSLQADLDLEQGEVELENLEQLILTDVRRTARAVETAAKQIQSAEVSSRLAQRNLEAEQKRYENGLSTSFNVLEIQEDLSAARSREVSATVAYRRAEVAFQRSIGRLLDEMGVVLLDDEMDAETETVATEMAEPMLEPPPVPEPPMTP